MRISFVQQQTRSRASAKEVPFGKKSKCFMGELPTPKVSHRIQK
jgi:hypothetical protein